MRARLLLSPNPAGAGNAPAVLNLSAILQHISFSIQNCNSLNVSTSCPKQSQKIKSIIDLNTDIIFLSDLRLNINESVNDVEKIFLTSSNKKYKFMHNSSKNSRGVGILISDELDYEICDVFRDVAENILGLRLKISSHFLVIISIYGPNTVDNVFFQDLSRFISLFPDTPIIVGGTGTSLSRLLIQLIILIFLVWPLPPV